MKNREDLDELKCSCIYKGVVFQIYRCSISNVMFQIYKCNILRTNVIFYICRCVPVCHVAVRALGGSAHR